MLHARGHASSHALPSLPGPLQITFGEFAGFVTVASLILEYVSQPDLGGVRGLCMGSRRGCLQSCSAALVCTQMPRPHAAFPAVGAAGGGDGAGGARLLNLPRPPLQPATRLFQGWPRDGGGRAV